MSSKDQKMMLKGVDENGQPILVTAAEWRSEVLPIMIKKAWDEPSMLYGVITLATDNGMVADVLEAAEHVYTIDTIPERATTMLAIITLRAGNLERAEKVLGDFFDKNDKTAMTLSCQARLLQAQGKDDQAKQSLHDALAIDPNNEIALDGWSACHLGEGDERIREALENIAATPGAWRPQTWLAHLAIERKDKSAAVALYAEAVKKSNSGREAVTLAAMDLGDAGYIIEMIDLLQELYNPDEHGVPPGWNLVQGYLQTGQKRRGILMLNKIDGLQPPEMTEAFQKMRQDLAKLPDEPA